MFQHDAPTPCPVLRVAVDELPCRLSNHDAELSLGRRIEIVRGDAVVAELRALEAEPLTSAVRPNAPDFITRMRARWGDHRFNDSTQWIERQAFCRSGPDR